MTGGSIRFRLWSAAAISIVVALALAGAGLVYLFERHVESRIESELAVYMKQLIGATTFATDGTLMISPVVMDPRFHAPLSGYYWQVENLATGTLTRSRSLWDATLTLAPSANSDTFETREATGPGNALLIVAERTVVDAKGFAFRVAVAEDHQELSASVMDYGKQLAPALVLLSLVLIAANFVQITVGLAPLEKLRNSVRDVVANRAARLDGATPREVRPLADEINRLLDSQEKALVRARSRATDLAHGLKTPLQVLSADIRLLRARGETELADEIGKSATAIRRHVDRELARVRVAPGIVTEVECRVAEAAAGIIGVVRRTPKGAPLEFAIDVPDDLFAPIDEGDLPEILGNLIENAARFARTRIRVEATQTPESIAISIADDGPGIAEEDRATVLSRGARLDTSGSSGSGLGLAIVSDIVGAYGGRLAMSDGNPGLKVTIILPRA